MGWLSEKNRKKTSENTMQAENTTLDASFPPISGIDTEKGIAMTGGTPEGYRQVLSMFRKDAEERTQKFRYFLYESMNGGKFPEKHLASLITQFQALKSASAAIGAAETSEKAARLEAAGRNRELAFIQDNLPDFLEHLTMLIKNVRAALEPKPDKSAAKTGRGFLGQVFAGKRAVDQQSAKGVPTGDLSLFNILTEALGEKNIADIDRILEELSKMPLEAEAKEVLEQVSDQVLMAEFESAIKTIKEFIGSNK
jgi:HPt (histidine-containing phosphotransfer) domain-containing protein